MGKSKIPADDQKAGDAKPTGPVRRGISAYQNVLQKKTSSGLEKSAKKPPLQREPAKSPEPPKPSAPLPKRTLPAEESPADSKYRRVAKFLVLIGGQEAAKILSALEVEQVEAISREIASLRGISAEEAGPILDEFRSLLDASYGYSGVSSGGMEAARRLLYAAFGPEKGESYLKKAVPHARERPFGFLDDFNGEQVALLLREESPATAALVLSRISPPLSAAVLANTLPERKLEIVRRIAHLTEVSPEVLERVADALREKARHIGHTETTAVDGMGALAAILKHADVSFGDRILEELEEEDPDLSRNLKDRIYTLEDLVRAEDRPIQEKLRGLSDRDIALLLKGRSPEFIDKIYANLSAPRQTLVREEGELMGPVPRVEVEAAARDFLAWFRLAREQGRILLLDDDDVIQ